MPISAKLIQTEIAKATVKLFVYDEFQGTGFFISPDYILTAFHCINKPIPSDIKIQIYSTQEEFEVEFDAEKSLIENGFDIAVLKVKSYQSPFYLPLGLVDEIHIGDELVSRGYPAYRADNQNLGLYLGNISRFRDDHRIENDAMEGKGQSGGPVYHYKTNLVVGLVSSGYKADKAKKSGLAIRFDELFRQ
ncbi:MAG: trypsin-like peptidase domain-containing protein [Thiomargarita sp.]|nr:trypsin-like peptidase domain-containing protein [Thiomargarita sp.]